MLKDIDKVTAGVLKVNGNYPFVAKGADPAKLGPIASQALITTTENCILCGLCAENCHWGAITVSDTVSTDYTKCLRCLHCKKNCPTSAKEIKEPKYYENVKQFEEWLSGRRREPELFYSE